MVYRELAEFQSYETSIEQLLTVERRADALFDRETYLFANTVSSVIAIFPNTEQPETMYVLVTGC